MRSRHNRHLLYAVIVIWLAGCASPARKESIVVDDMPLNASHPYSVTVKASGGGETESIGYTNISNADLAGAVEDSIVKTRLFSKVVKNGEADYKLSVLLVSMSKPMFGMNFKIDMEMAWSLVNARTGDVVWRESVRSSHTATFEDSFAAVTRIRIAIEEAAEENIRRGLRKIAALTLN